MNITKLRKHLRFEPEGMTIVIVHAKTKRALRWLQHKFYSEPWQWVGARSLAIEPRFAEIIFDASKEEFV